MIIENSVSMRASSLEDLVDNLPMFLSKASDYITIARDEAKESTGDFRSMMDYVYGFCFSLAGYREYDNRSGRSEDGISFSEIYYEKSSNPDFKFYIKVDQNQAELRRVA